MIEISQITGANILPDVSRDLKNSVSLGWWVIPRFTAKISLPEIRDKMALARAQ